MATPLLFACSSSSNGGTTSGAVDSGDDGANAADTGSDELVADANDNPYPAGPYGTKVGDVLADVSLVGYAHFDSRTIANTVDYAPTSLSELRKLVTTPYGVLHVAELW